MLEGKRSIRSPSPARGRRDQRWRSGSSSHGEALASATAAGNAPGCLAAEIRVLANAPARRLTSLPSGVQDGGRVFVRKDAKAAALNSRTATSVSHRQEAPPPSPRVPGAQQVAPCGPQKAARSTPRVRPGDARVVLRAPLPSSPAASCRLARALLARPTSPASMASSASDVSAATSGPPSQSGFCRSLAAGRKNQDSLLWTAPATDPAPRNELPCSLCARIDGRGAAAAQKAEARTDRKIEDLKITNKALAAINSQLERRTRRQTSRIAELEKLLRNAGIDFDDRHSDDASVAFEGGHPRRRRRGRRRNEPGGWDASGADREGRTAEEREGDCSSDASSSSSSSVGSRCRRDVRLIERMCAVTEALVVQAQRALESTSTLSMGKVVWKEQEEEDDDEEEQGRRGSQQASRSQGAASPPPEGRAGATWHQIAARSGS